MASSDSSSSSSSDSLPSGREIRRELVWLKEKVKSTPRGHNWDLLNRDGRVQEVCFTTGMSKKQTREAIVTTFPGLRGIKDKRYDFHSFAWFTENILSCLIQNWNKMKEKTEFLGSRFLGRCKTYKRKINITWPTRGYATQKYLLSLLPIHHLKC